MSLKRGYYAVAVGRVPGIFNTWEECQAQTTGFPGAKFKKFKSEAEASLFVSVKPPTTTTRPPVVQKRNLSEPYNITRATPQIDTSIPKPQVAKQSSGDLPVVKTARPTKVVNVFPSGESTLSLGPPLSSSTLQKQKLVKPKAKDADVDDSDKLIVWTDGACRSNGQAGAKAGVGVWYGDNDPRNLSERLPGRQTNQRAELMATIRCLQELKKAKTTVPIEVRTDSNYVVKGITDWIYNWKKKDFKDVVNTDLWLLLDEARQDLDVTWTHIFGHAGIYGNEQADKLAVEGCFLNEKK